MTRSPRRLAALAVIAVSFTSLGACSGESFEATSSTSAPASGSLPRGVALRLLIASSGAAETAAVKAATSAWGSKTGNTVEVTAAANMDQELAQGFAGGNPADIIYMDAAKFATFAKQGSLEPYADDFPGNDAYFESLRRTFTYAGKQYCVPKDFSTLALIINTAMWKAAGLTDADIPRTWDELSTVATKLTSGGVVGLGIGVGIDRLGAFVVENGGWWVNADGSAGTAADPLVVGALKYVQDNVVAGSFAMSNDLGAGWGGEAFGKKQAAMTIEGNWITGALRNDYPGIDYRVVEMPAGPAGKGTLMFTQCWGLAADSAHKDLAKDLIAALTTPQQQLAFADAFGVMPSRTDAAAEYASRHPEDAAFVAGGQYGHGPITVPGLGEVVAELNSRLESMATVDLPGAMKAFDANAAAALGG